MNAFAWLLGTFLDIDHSSQWLLTWTSLTFRNLIHFSVEINSAATVGKWLHTVNKSTGYYIFEMFENDRFMIKVSKTTPSGWFIGNDVEGADWNKFQ